MRVAIPKKRGPLIELAPVIQEAGCTWSEFVESMGIPYPGQKKRLDWTKRTVLAEIRKRSRRGLGLNSKAVVRDVGQALVQQARKRFGSWDEALREAGLDPARIRMSRVWTRKDIIAAIRARERAGKSMVRRDAVADDPRLVKAATKEFPSSWARALAAAGLNPAMATGGSGLSGRKSRKKS